jgi:AraC family transcriptional regulator
MKINLMERACRQVTIVDFIDTKIAALEHRGDPRLIGESVQRFIAWRKRSHLSPSENATFNILYDDPSAVPPEKFRIDIGVAFDREIADNEQGIVCKTIPGGRCAMLRHTGLEDTLSESIRYLVLQWFPSSGESRRDFPIFLQRVRFFPEVPEEETVVDLFLPIL